MQENGHVIIPSSRIVPDNDATTLFTGSGMQPMLPYLLEQPHPLGKRIADSQKCFRSQDIEEVGDNRHTIFFEMLGNWSLGDYFKEEQIDLMWDFIINKIKLNPDRVYVSVYKGNSSLGIDKDEVSIKKWQEKFTGLNIEAKLGLDPEVEGMEKGVRIFAYPDKKNWWSRSGVPKNMPVGEPGGPDTEMFYDFDPSGSIHDKSVYKDNVCHPNCDCGRFVEFGNNVFMQYKKTEAGVEELKQKNVDFGGGLERIVAALNNDPDVFNIDTFEKAKNKLEILSGQKYVSDVSVTFTDTTNPTFAYRVILDHVRAATFLIADGVLPGNKDQMYFVRRIIRRAIRYARNININNNFTADIATTFIEYYKDLYEELLVNGEVILEELNKEESKFRKTLEGGIKEFDKIYNKNPNQNISGKDAFDLLQSFGFPVELTIELAKEKDLLVDLEEFNHLRESHANASRTASAGKFKGGLGGDGIQEIKYHTATHMLHQALKMVLGESVSQKGSNITAERIRFDFAFDRKMADEEKKKVEDIINEVIKADYPMIREEMSCDEARERGAVGLFDDKYGDRVSVYHMGSNSKGKKRGEDGMFSIEFCGGPHVERTGDMGTFKIVKEEAVSQGVRRIKAVLE
ncbi:MAG: alanyl-tRNA synthetase [Patescibacteria group bacterium]|nr:alanyl-tRNA synthetase [Patescibacteria group bacterium]